MYGVCKKCGCTDNDPCFNPDWGMCWWVDETHELCSHCAEPEIAESPATCHCINSTDSWFEPTLDENCGTCKNMYRDENECMLKKCHYEKIET
jgi:hypothetical protein